MAKSKKLKLTHLLVNTENYRFESVASQKEAIDKMVEDQADKLYNLAVDIIENGLNPNDKIQVVPSNHDAKKFNVLEGNRRAVTLKLLNNPDLIDSDKHLALKKKLRKLADGNRAKIIRELECTVYDSPSEADKWIKLKHAGQSDGVGTVAWTAQQVQRFEEKVEGRSSIALQTIKILEKSNDVPVEIKTNLRSLRVTNLDRLLSDPTVRDFLGIEINNGFIQSEVNEKEVVKGLTQIAKDLLNPKFKVAAIYTKDDRKDYLKKFPKASKPNTKNKAPKPWQFNSTIDTVASKPTAKTKPNPKDRSVLIPKSCHLQINNPKVNAIYHELQKLQLPSFANVAAVAFRVFIENSMDCFIEANKMETTKDGKPLSKDSKLIIKITEVANFLESSGLADKHICKGIRNAVNTRNDLLGTETLNAYVHNSAFAAIPAHLVTSWDNVQTFMEKIWGNIK